MSGHRPGNTQRAQRELDLQTYYDNEIADRADRSLDPERVARRHAFVDLLHAEDRQAVLEIGCGAGRDALALADAGLTCTGVDLAAATVAHCRALGLQAFQASVLRLPFDDASFDAGWTMSTLLHVADADLSAALAEIARVLRPGAPLAVGLWGGTPSEGTPGDGDSSYGPARFFAIRDDETVRAALAAIGDVERFETWQPPDGPWHYQWALVRR